MAKSAEAFRTISEVADWLETPAHVLRFWESKFSQVKPVKRAGGRRYYRPTDMQLLGGIKKLLHDDGMTIKGVQKILRENGVKHVVALSQALDEVTEAEASELAEDVTPADEGPATGTVLSFQRDSEAGPADTKPAKTDARSDDTSTAKPAPSAKPESAPAPEPDAPASEESTPALPSFMHRRPEPEPASKAETPTAKAPTKIEVPADPKEDIDGTPGALSALARFEGPIPKTLASKLADLRDRLSPHLSDGSS
ncbi:MerR family transcriptional regulator [Roseovarius sp. 2305UL8-3]|uniref:MerR family transcriptional regulator n=1 Tax=Roseovarius conchicola TaxID=3121636 RepID=UPI003526CE42